MNWFPRAIHGAARTHGTPEADSGATRIEPDRRIRAIGNDPRGDQQARKRVESQSDPGHVIPLRDGPGGANQARRGRMHAATIGTGLIDPRGRPARAEAAPASAELRAPRNPARAVGPGRTAGDPRRERTLTAYHRARGDPVMNRPVPGTSSGDTILIFSELGTVPGTPYLFFRS